MKHEKLFGFSGKAFQISAVVCIALNFVSKSHSATTVMLDAGAVPSATGDNDTLPDGCGNAFQEVNRFNLFFETTIGEIAAKRGPEARGVVDLFAVSEIRSSVSRLFPALSEESPVDRLIISQLCQFKKIRAADLKPGANPQAAQVLSSDLDLHNHLVSVSAKLFADSRRIIMDALAKRAQERVKAESVAARKDDVQRARELGKDKVKDILQ